jgi:cyclohexadieny/prephenate dehydrogenase
MPDRLGHPRDTPLFERLVLIGFGLVGSSIARAARHLNLARTVVAADRDETVVARALALDIADEATTDLAAAVT